MYVDKLYIYVDKFVGGKGCCCCCSNVAGADPSKVCVVPFPVTARVLFGTKTGSCMQSVCSSKASTQSSYESSHELWVNALLERQQDTTVPRRLSSMPPNLFRCIVTVQTSRQAWICPARMWRGITAFDPLHSLAAPSAVFLLISTPSHSIDFAASQCLHHPKFA